ncbi:MAG: hypothetical protein KAS93_08085 [Gammaproteobacteria bacterium]|nr:hypothetical protein [Gammaproteobacteria bacterium]
MEPDGTKPNIEVASDAIGAYVVAKANDAVTNRVWIEDRWLDDMRQLKGCETEDRHDHNVTKEKTLTAEARISDMLFQQGDKNFSVTADLDVAPEQKASMDDAAQKLEDKITNLLDESQYESKGRAAIKQACELGVGVVKGPVQKTSIQKDWQQAQDQAGNTVNMLELTVSSRSSVDHVSTWDYFPDLAPAEQKDCSYEFQRHWLSKTDLQNLLLRDDFNKEEILNIISTESPAEQPRHLVELRDESLPESNANNYIIWEGYLKIPSNLVKDLCCQEPEREGNYFDEGDAEKDKFDIECLVWVSDSGKLLKFAPNPLETDERPFGVFCYDRDTTCFMASEGIPRLLRKPQRDINASWQRIHKNSDLSVGPQWIVDALAVEPIPIEGKTSWEMTPNKGWRGRKPNVDLQRAFHFFNVPSGVQENMLILQQSLQFADVETQLPQIASGEQSEGMTKTFSGMELLINASNTVQRRIIKDWDDYVTVPMIGRMIDDLMQNSPMAGVFGKFIPNAQGTASLLLKETSAKNAMNLAQVAASNPQFAQRTNWDGLYSQIVRGLQSDPAIVIKSEDQLKQEAQQEKPPAPEMIEAQANMLEAQNEQAKVQLDMQKWQAKEQREKRELQLREQKAQMDYDVAIKKIALEDRKMEVTARGKVVEIDMKGKQKREEIVTSAKAAESKMANEYLIEKNSDVKI